VTDLERFAAVLLAEWQAESGRPDLPINVGGLVDRVLPYRSARKALALETSEDYELLVLRLVAEEGGLVTTEPAEAAEMARETLSSKIPDLDVMALLRSATLTMTDDAVARLDGVRPLPPAAPPPAAPPPRTEPIEGVLSLHRTPEVADATATPAPRMPAEPPPAFLTKVAFTPPDASCWQCSAPLPTGRKVSFCVECGADQRAPRCRSCGATVELHWKHCPDCGQSLARS
jgi:hypothetical protein